MSNVHNVSQFRLLWNLKNYWYYILLSRIFKKEGKLPRAAPQLDVSDAWSLTSLRFSYKWALSLFGGSSRGAQLLVHRGTVVRREELVLFHRARSFGRDTHGPVREEGDTRLASQISRINPSDQWGDRCRSQIALTSSKPLVGVLLMKHYRRLSVWLMVLFPMMLWARNVNSPWIIGQKRPITAFGLLSFFLNESEILYKPLKFRLFCPVKVVFLRQ